MRKLYKMLGAAALIASAAVAAPAQAEGYAWYIIYYSDNTMAGDPVGYSIECLSGPRYDFGTATQYFLATQPIAPSDRVHAAGMRLAAPF